MTSVFFSQLTKDLVTGSVLFYANIIFFTITKILGDLVALARPYGIGQKAMNKVNKGTQRKNKRAATYRGPVKLEVLKSCKADENFEVAAVVCDHSINRQFSIIVV